MSRMSHVVLMLVCATLLASCNDDDSPGVTSPTVPVTAGASTGPWFRIANLSSDLHKAEVRLDGRVFNEQMGYPTITGYRQVEPGSHNIRFVPPPKVQVDPRTVELGTTFTVGPGEAVTIVAAGLVDTRTLTVVDIRDDLMPSGEQARIRLINAMSDFPSTLDLWQNPNIALVRRVQFLGEPPFRDLNAGNHPLEVRRTGTRGPLLPVVP